MLLQESGPAQTGYDTGKRFSINIPIHEVAHARCVSTATQFKNNLFYSPLKGACPVYPMYFGFWQDVFGIPLHFSFVFFHFS